MISSVITLMSAQTNGLLDLPMFSAHSLRPQTLQNHILTHSARAKHLESHPCAKTGGGVHPALTVPPLAALRIESRIGAARLKRSGRVTSQRLPNSAHLSVLCASALDFGPRLKETVWNH